MELRDSLFLETPVSSFHTILEDFNLLINRLLNDFLFQTLDMLTLPSCVALFQMLTEFEINVVSSNTKACLFVRPRKICWATYLTLSGSQLFQAWGIKAVDAKALGVLFCY